MAPFYQILPLTLPDINKGSICSLNLEEKYIIAGYVQKPSLRIWNPNAGLCVKTFKNGESKDVATLFNKTNEYIVSSSSSVEDLGKIHLYKKGKKDKDWVEECFYGANKAFIFTDADRFVTAGRGGRDYFSSVVKSVSINDKYIAGAFEDSSVKLFKYNKQTGTKCTSGFYKVLYPNKYHDESLTPANIENIKAAQEQNFKTEKNITNELTSEQKKEFEAKLEADDNTDIPENGKIRMGGTAGIDEDGRVTNRQHTKDNRGFQKTPVKIRFMNGTKSNILLRAFQDTIRTLDTSKNKTVWKFGEAKKIGTFKNKPDIIQDIDDMDIDNNNNVAVIYNNNTFTYKGVRQFQNESCVEVFIENTKQNFKLEFKNLLKCCAIHDGTLVISGEAVDGEENKIYVIDINSKKIQQELHVPDKDVINHIDINDKMIVCGGKSGKIYMYSPHEFGTCNIGWETLGNDGKPKITTPKAGYQLRLKLKF